MANTGALLPGTAASASIGTAWVNPNNIKLDDGSSATCSSSADFSVSSAQLNATNFSFGIPAGAVINGIVVQIKRAKNRITINDNTVTVLKAGATTANRRVVGTWPDSLEYISYGSPTDLWGTTWTVANVNASTTGCRLIVAITGDSINNTIASVDAVKMTVYYNNYLGASIQGVSQVDGVASITFK